MERCKVHYKGEGGGFPQVWAMVNLMSLSCPWLVLTPRVFQLCINHLVLVLCRFMRVVETCQFFLVPSQSSNMPFYPSKVLLARERAWLFTLPLFSVWTHIWILQRVGNMSHVFKSTCPIWLSGQIDQMSKWLIFCLLPQSNKRWFVVVHFSATTLLWFHWSKWQHLHSQICLPWIWNCFTRSQLPNVRWFQSIHLQQSKTKIDIIQC